MQDKKLKYTVLPCGLSGYNSIQNIMLCFDCTKRDCDNCKNQIWFCCLNNCTIAEFGYEEIDKCYSSHKKEVKKNENDFEPRQRNSKFDKAGH